MHLWHPEADTGLEYSCAGRVWCSRQQWDANPASPVRLVSMQRRIKRAEGHVRGVLETVTEAQFVGLCGAHYAGAIFRLTRLTQCVTVHLQAPPRRARRSRLPRSDELRREPGPRVIFRCLTLLRTGNWCSHIHALELPRQRQLLSKAL